MLEVRLHGALAEFGEVWHLDVASPAEAIRAISTLKPGFLQAIVKLDQSDFVFKVSTPVHDYVADELQMSLGRQTRLDIIPIIRGASAGVRFVIGAVITAIGLISGFQPLTAVGISMMLGSVVEWLTPVQKPSTNENGQSWSISGADANIEQGNPVPVVYGEVLAPAYPISGGVSVSRYDMSPKSASIGGRLDNYVEFTQAITNPSIEVLLTAGWTGIADPTTVTWSYTGFPTASSVVLTKVGTSVKIRLTVNGDWAPEHWWDSKYDETGSVTLTVVGKDPTDPLNSRTATATASLRLAMACSD